MQTELTGTDRLGLFYKLRQLGDAELAVLAAWRDVERYCTERDLDLVPQEYAEHWYKASQEPVRVLKWLTQLSPQPEGADPQYWQQWHQAIIQGVIDHFNALLAISLLP